MSIDAIGSDKCQINFTTPTVQALYRNTEEKHLAEIADLKDKIADLMADIHPDLRSIALDVVGSKLEIAELKSQVEDLQEQVRNTNTQSNLKDWEIKFLKEDVKRLNAKTYEKRHLLQTKDTED